MKKTFSIILLSFILLVPFSFHKMSINNVFATQVIHDGGTGNNNSGSGSGSGSSVNIKLVNPLKDGNVDDIPSFVKKILEVVMKIGVPLVAVAIIYTGYLFIAAQGNEKKLEEAKQAIVWVFVGAVILLGAYAIALALQGTMNAIRGV